jgi:hypothetical protein
MIERSAPEILPAADAESLAFARAGNVIALRLADLRLLRLALQWQRAVAKTTPPSVC